MVNKNLVRELRQVPGFFVGTILLALVGAFATVLEYWSLASLINGIIFTHADEQTLWANLLWTLVGLGLKVLARAMSDYFGLRLSEKFKENCVGPCWQKYGGPIHWKRNRCQSVS